MKVLRRPSFYFFVVPFLGIAVGLLLHEAMGCGYECTGRFSGPLDRAALFAAYLFGYGLPLFMGLAAFVFLLEVVYFRLRARREVSSQRPPLQTQPDKRTNES